MKAHIDRLDYTIEVDAENALLMPPSTSRKDQQVVLNYIASYYSSNFVY